MQEAALSMAALPNPARVLGLAMRPYSLGHELFLIREFNPLVEEGAKAKLEDLKAAALICCQSHEECRRMRDDPLIKLKLWLWNKRCARLGFRRELRKFRQYRNSGLLEFRHSDIPRPGSSRGR